MWRKFEYQNTKYETNSKDQNTNDQNEILEVFLPFFYRKFEYQNTKYETNSKFKKENSKRLSRVKSGRSYLPMQNRLKMRSSRSSV